MNTDSSGAKHPLLAFVDIVMEENQRQRKGTAGIKSKLPSSTKSVWQRIGPYALISLAAFICGAPVLGVMIWKADKLVALGLAGNLYYIVLLPLGLAVAAFLFGVFKSFARYRGKQLGGTLELGGPIVGFALVVIGGFVLPKPGADAFAVTAYVHGESSPNDLVLRNTGLVWMTLGADRRAEKIGDKGQADFKGIPSRFRGQEVSIWVEADGFEMAEPAAKYSLQEDQLYLAVRKKSGHVVGQVQDENGRPIAGAAVSAAGLSTRTDSNGRFELAIPGDKLAKELSLQVVAPDYEPWRSLVVPNANEATVILHHAR